MTQHTMAWLWNRLGWLALLCLPVLSLPAPHLVRAQAARTDQPARPNFVWIVLDDVSPNFGCYGDSQAITPNIDRLAREGARFTNAFTHAPVCAPSRSGLLTGMYATTIG